MIRKTVIIVDDEPAARQSLKDVIATFESLHVVAEAGDGKSAIELIVMKRPDIVFLDIEMPEMTGFDVAKATQKLNYQLVFLTAYEKYALKAFDTNAIDYLVKPAHPELVRKSIRKMLRQEGVVLEQQSTSDDGERLVLGDQSQQKILEYDHINYVEGIGRYRRVHLTEVGIKLHKTDTILSDMTLDDFSARLPERSFYRIHRSYIVNRERMLELKLQSRRHFVRLVGTATLIPVSRSFVATLKDDFKNNA